MGNVPVLFAAGGVAGVLSWAVTYPQDVIKSRMQADAANKYRGVTHCLKASLAAEGGRVLWRGLGSALIRAFPLNAVTLGVHRMLLNHFQGDDSGIKEVGVNSNPFGDRLCSLKYLSLAYF